MYKSHFFVPISYPKARVRLIYEVQVFSGLITNCNHKLSSRWSHINAATSGMGGSVGESDDEDFEGFD